MNKSFTNPNSIDKLTEQAGQFVTIGRKLSQQASGLKDQRAEVHYAIDFTAGLLILIGLQLRLAARPLQSVNNLFLIDAGDTIAPFGYKELMKMESMG